ncbi:hypothetical protein PYCC9005_002328 [Savitreella phatthalungensis]
MTSRRHRPAGVTDAPGRGIGGMLRRGVRGDMSGSSSFADSSMSGSPLGVTTLAPPTTATMASVLDRAAATPAIPPDLLKSRTARFITTGQAAAACVSFWRECGGLLEPYAAGDVRDGADGGEGGSDRDVGPMSSRHMLPSGLGIGGLGVGVGASPPTPSHGRRHGYAVGVGARAEERPHKRLRIGQGGSERARLEVGALEALDDGDRLELRNSLDVVRRWVALKEEEDLDRERGGIGDEDGAERGRRRYLLDQARPRVDQDAARLREFTWQRAEALLERDAWRFESISTTGMPKMKN